MAWYYLVNDALAQDKDVRVDDSGRHDVVATCDSFPWRDSQIISLDVLVLQDVQQSRLP